MKLLIIFAVFYSLIVHINSYAIHNDYSDPQIVVRILGNNSEVSFYLLYHHTFRTIPDEYTAIRLSKTLNSKVQDMYDVSYLLPYKQIEDPIETLRSSNNSPDELVRLELLAITILQKNIISKLFKIGEYFNPSIAILKEWILMVYRGKAYTHDPARFSIISRDEMQITSTSDTAVQSILKLSSNDLFGNSNIEDIRLLTIKENERYLLSFTNLMGSEKWRMGEAILQLDELQHSFLVINKMYLIVKDETTERTHKNWIPFIENDSNSIYYVEHIHPLKIITSNNLNFSNETNSLTQYMKLVSISKCESLSSWNWGELRGGTPAYYLSHQKLYLAFFHSKTKIPGSNYWMTYFFGAFTFMKSSLTNTFEIHTISQVPILKRELYDGVWAKSKSYDYIIYPMGFYIKNNLVVLSLGRNDHEGWIAEMSLQELLNSLVKFQC